MKFKKINIEENTAYEGKIVKYSIDADQTYFRVFVEITGMKGAVFMRCIRFADFIPSTLGSFCELFGIIDNRGDVKFDDLIDMQVVVSLTLGKDGYYYISEIEPEGDDYEE